MRSKIIYFLISIFALGCSTSDDGANSGPLVVSYRTGSVVDKDAVSKTGVVLMGGADAFTTAETASFQFLVDRAGGGDFVVLRASGADGYNDFIFNDIGNVNSVTTFIVDSREKAESNELAANVAKAEAVFIAGGDQSKYLNYWKGTSLNQVLNELLNEKQIPIGGTSAGLAVLGDFYYGAYSGSATSSELLANPYHENTEGLAGEDFLQAPFMDEVLTDSHYNERNRQGRHFGFIARLLKDKNTPGLKGIGVDEATAVMIDENGLASIIGDGDAYFLRAFDEGPEVCNPGQALTWNRNGKAVEVFKIPGSSGYEFDVEEWDGPDELQSYWYADDGAFFND